MFASSDKQESDGTEIRQGDTVSGERGGDGCQMEMLSHPPDMLPVQTEVKL